MKARGRTQTVIAFGAFTLLALAVFRPTPAQLSGTIPAFQGAAGDVLQQMWAIGHVSRTLFRDPLNLFDGNVFYPAKDTLACADHMIGQAVAGFPIWLATHNLPLEFNLLSLASYVLCALAAFAYARAQLGDTVAAALAGLVFAFNPYRFHSPQWLQVLFTPFVPLAFLFWLRFVRTLATRDWLLWVGCWVLQSLMGMYLMLYVAALTGVFGLFALVAAPQRHSPRLWKGTLLAPLAAAVLLAPTLLPYWRLRVTHGHVRTSGLDSSLSFFLPGPGTLSGALSGLGGLTPGQFGPGLLVAVLLVGGIVAARRRARADCFRRFAFRVHLLGLVLTLAWIVVPLRWQQLLPGFDMIRATNRAFYLTLLFIGVFAAEAVAALRARLSGTRVRAAASTALAALLLADLGTPPRERIPLPAGSGIPPVYRWIERLPPDAVVYENVIGIGPSAMAMYYSIAHGKRIPNGYGRFVHPVTDYVNMRLYRFPAPEAHALLGELGIGWVLRHFASDQERDDFVAHSLADGVSVAATFGTDVVFAVRPMAAPVVPAAVALDRTRWVVAASSSVEQAENVRDADPSTSWHTQGLGPGKIPWLRVDLDAEVPVTGLRVLPGPADVFGVSVPEIEVSLDAVSWQGLGALLHPESFRDFLEHPRARQYFEARFAPRPARYVRLISPTVAFWGGSWDVAELEVLGVAAPNPAH